MSKGDYVILHVSEGSSGVDKITIKATVAGRRVRLLRTKVKYTAQEMMGKKVVHEVEASTKNVIAVEKWFQRGSAINGR